MLTSTDFQRLQSKCTPLHLPKFQTLKDKYETTDVQIKIFKFQVDIFKEKKNLQHNIKEIEEEMKLLKKKNDELEQQIIEIANKSSDIHEKLQMPILFGKEDCPQNMKDYDSVPRFYPESPNSSFQLTWNNLIRAAGTNLSQEGYKQVLGCKLFKKSSLYYNLYKQLPLPELVEKLNNRYRLDKTSDVYEREVQNYKKSLDKNLTQTFEELKFLIDNAYKHRNEEEKKAIMNTTIRGHYQS